MKKLVCMLLAMSLLVSVTALSACQNGNGDGSDTQTTSGSDAGETTTTAPPNDPQTPSDKLNCTFTVTDQDGTPLANVTVNLMADGKTVLTVKTDAAGKGSGAVAAGNYTVVYENLPEYHLPDTSTLKITEQNLNVSLTVTNNKPNGSMSRPFPILEDNISVTLPVGETYYFITHSPAPRSLTVENANVEILYNEETYAPVDGKIEFSFAAESAQAPARIAVTNRADTEQELTLQIMSPLGSMDNPHVLTSEGETVTAEVAEGQVVYYRWVATRSGMLMVYSESDVNNIEMFNERTSVLSAATNGAAYGYISVAEGDAVQIRVSTKDESAANVAFVLNEYATTEEDPLPLTQSELAIRIEANSTAYFTADAVGKTLTVYSATATVTYNDTVYEPTSGSIVVTLGEGDGESVVFAITNTASEYATIAFELK